MLPVQVSAVSQTPSAERQVTLEATNTSDRQVLDVPLQDSAVSQMPLEARQVSVVLAFRSVGQVLDDPVQNSATSHTPLLERHSVVLGALASPGQDAEVPVQVSAASQLLTAARQVVLVLRQTFPLSSKMWHSNRPAAADSSVNDALRMHFEIQFPIQSLPASPLRMS